MTKRLLDIMLARKGAKPIRRTSNVIVAPDPDSGQVDAQPAQDELVFLSPDGSIDKVNIAHRNVYHCGCDHIKPFGGRCIECGLHSCNDCFGRCCSCNRPLCLEHSRFLEIEPGQSRRFCCRCAGELKRRQFRSAVIRQFLSPFVKFDGKEGGAR